MKTPEEIKEAMRHCLTSDSYAIPDPCRICPFGENCHDGMTDALAYIEQLEAAQPKWISVKDRLPGEQTDRYFVTIKTYEGIQVTQTCVWAWNENDEVGKFIHWGDKITHWMPMPEPPKED